MRALGGASKWWLHGSLEALARMLDQRGSSLVLRRGAAEKVLPALVQETDAGAVFWNRRYGASREIDARLKERFRGDGLEVESFAANLLVEPWTLRTSEGGPYRVFTPYWKALRDAPFREEVPAPRTIDPHPADSERLEDWKLLPTRPDWAGGLRDTWTPGERGARQRLDTFVADHLVDYHRRDEPAVEATSMLSPHLRFGEISPLQVWNRVHGDVPTAAKKNVAKFLSEIGWREFNHNILFHFTALATDNYRPDFDAFPWEEPKPDELKAWQQGRTGIPLVDAGMRELWSIGYMHNRVRMVTASFLIKNLLVDWRIGEAWFWDTLVDADEANNPGNWQWVAGSGADAAPYFRVFNPELQGTKFDPRGEYIGRWVAEIGTDEYPEPMVDLKETRRHALDAYEMTRKRVR
jgi:deoxyribodipyrimidine photo-lyase